MMRNGLGVMTDVTCLGELLGIAQLSMSLGLIAAALGIAVRTFTVLRIFFGLSCKLPLTLPSSLLQERVEEVSRYLLM